MARVVAVADGRSARMVPVTGSTVSGLGLAVTTATGAVGVAVGPIGGEALAAVQLETDRRHAEELIPRIQEALAGAGATPGDLDVLVVDVGPGRFTGLRVGLATVRSLAFALRIPVVALTSLEIVAAGWPGHGGAADRGRAFRSSVAVDGDGLDRRPSVVTAVVDARRGEVFQQVFAVERSLPPTVTPRVEPVVGRAQEVVVEADGIIVGDGADQYCDVYRSHGRPVLAGSMPDAVVMLALATSRPSRPGTEIEPVYLRDPDVNPNVRLRPRAVAMP